MKRTPLARKTPMRRRSLPQGPAVRRRRGSSGLPEGASRAEHGMAYPEARRVILERSRGLCELPGCGARIDLHSMQAHHRLTRRLGPDCPCNLLALCGPCHHERVHGEPEAARAAGWIVSRHTVVPPAEVPVSLEFGASGWLCWLLLDCDGNFARTPCA